ncbi:unnamed protein product, partial [Rotaria socialis]
MSHLHASTPCLWTNAVNQLSDCFSSDEGCRILTNAVGDECKVLQDIKKILEKRASIDEQYAKNLQDLTANANKISWPTSTHPIAPVSREIFSQWSQLAITMSSNAKLFRESVLDDLMKGLLEQKTDSKTFFEEERRRYDGEHRK